MTESSPEQAVEQAWDDLIERCTRYWQLVGFPQAEDDPLWRSPCQQQNIGDGVVCWQPARRTQEVDFSATEDALDISFDAGVKVFLGRYYADTIEVIFQGQRVSLVQAWNDADTLRLQENLIAHILMQRRLKQPDTLFIGSTDDEFQVVCVVNATGEVVLETLGKGRRDHLADNLAAFLAKLQPAKPSIVAIP